MKNFFLVLPTFYVSIPLYTYTYKITFTQMAEIREKIFTLGQIKKLTKITIYPIICTFITSETDSSSLSDVSKRTFCGDSLIFC